MNSLSSSSSFSSSLRLFATRWYTYRAPQLSFSAPKRRRSRPRRRFADASRSNFSDDSNISLLSISTCPSAETDDLSLRLILDVHRISALASSRFHWFLDSGRDAFSDLRSLIALDENRRIVVSCRKSTLQFVGGLVVLGFVFGFAVRALVILGSAFRGSFENKPKVVVRRDRSLGGREVVVAIDKNRAPSRDSRKSMSSRQVYRRNASPTGFWVRARQNLPKWWPISLPTQSEAVDKQDYQREANRLIRGKRLQASTF